MGGWREGRRRPAVAAPLPSLPTPPKALTTPPTARAWPPPAKGQRRTSTATRPAPANCSRPGGSRGPCTAAMTFVPPHSTYAEPDARVETSTRMTDGEGRGRRRTGGRRRRWRRAGRAAGWAAAQPSPPNRRPHPHPAVPVPPNIRTHRCGAAPRGHAHRPERRHPAAPAQAQAAGAPRQRRPRAAWWMGGRGAGAGSLSGRGRPPSPLSPTFWPPHSPCSPPPNPAQASPPPTGPWGDALSSGERDPAVGAGIGARRAAGWGVPPGAASRARGPPPTPGPPTPPQAPMASLLAVTPVRAPAARPGRRGVAVRCAGVSIGFWRPAGWE